MITFESGMDIRSRSVSVPTVAKLHLGNGRYVFCVIGTQYGHIHTSGGDVKTWLSYSGARRFAKSYIPF